MPKPVPIKFKKETLVLLNIKKNQFKSIKHKKKFNLSFATKCCETYQILKTNAGTDS